jgi:hypothetical protein
MVFTDYDNDFSCDTLEEWIEHLAKTELTYSGITTCVTCGEEMEFTWTGKLKNGKTYPDVLCKSCKEQ